MARVLVLLMAFALTFVTALFTLYLCLLGGTCVDPARSLAGRLAAFLPVLVAVLGGVLAVVVSIKGRRVASSLGGGLGTLALTAVVAAFALLNPTP